MQPLLRGRVLFGCFVAHVVEISIGHSEAGVIVHVIVIVIIRYCIVSMGMNE